MIVGLRYKVACPIHPITGEIVMEDIPVFSSIEAMANYIESVEQRKKQGLEPKQHPGPRPIFFLLPPHKDEKTKKS